MEIDRIEQLQGNPFEVLGICISCLDRLHIELELYINYDNCVYMIRFYNVSRFTIDHISAPLMIHGFEIIDHLKDGWDLDSRYEARDFENDSIGFYYETAILEKAIIE